MENTKKRLIIKIVILVIALAIAAVAAVDFWTLRH